MAAGISRRKLWAEFLTKVTRSKEQDSRIQKIRHKKQGIDTEHKEIQPIVLYIFF